MKLHFGRSILLAVLACAIGVSMAGAARFWARRHAFTPVARESAERAERDLAVANLTSFQRKLLAELDREVRAGIIYQDGYYVGGDPPDGIGVCSDVVIRGFRAAGVDLKQTVSMDVRSAKSAYRIDTPDPNIDHRRCRNLAVFFRRQGQELPLTGKPESWAPGDIVLWSTRGNGYIDHVGIVSTGHDPQGNPTIIHHWPGLPVTETDGLFRFRVMGHDRWRAQPTHGQ